MPLPTQLRLLFPNSIEEPFEETSPPTKGSDSIQYNCIAWAYEDNTQWYWPHPNRFWPENIPMEVSLNAFQRLFESKGYEVCFDSSLEEGLKKIAIYSKNDLPTHAARQLPDGLWTSKLGTEHDVSHTIEGMSDGYYGNVAVIMKKKI